jgi:toxin-antitoxin system PIN domain toxin
LILIDANLLLYAYDSSTPHHDRAREWFEEILSGEEDVRLALTSVFAFLRIGTNPAVFSRPFTAAEAISIVLSWLDQPGVALAHPTDAHWSVLDDMCRAGQARGPILMDAHLAALAVEHGASLCTTDRDFARFPRLKVIDPLLG